MDNFRTAIAILFFVGLALLIGAAFIEQDTENRVRTHECDAADGLVIDTNHGQLCIKNLERVKLP